MAEVFEAGGDTLPPSVAHNLMRLIAEQEEEVQATAVGIFMRLLDRPAGRPLPGVLLHTVCWVLGEYGRLAGTLAAPERASVTQVRARKGGVGVLSRGAVPHLGGLVLLTRAVASSVVSVRIHPIHPPTPIHPIHPHHKPTPPR